MRCASATSCWCATRAAIVSSRRLRRSAPGPWTASETRKPELLRTAATWITRLDTSDTAATGVKVYRVRYGDAKQLASLLNDMFIGKSGGTFDSPTNQLAPGSGATTLSGGSGAGGGFG